MFILFTKLVKPTATMMSAVVISPMQQLSQLPSRRILRGQVEGIYTAARFTTKTLN